jgi:hypothetical protein
MGIVHEMTKDYPKYRNMKIEDDWNKKAFCKGKNTNIFLDPSREAEAKKFCNQCTVSEQCLAYAFQRSTEMAGVYGGINEITRARIKRTFQRTQRERKACV